jgi:phosphoribosylaminoimidazole-succinocarboxamide synthase
VGATVVYKTDFEGLTLFSRGKVRDVYDLGETLLIVATDRISAFDVVMPNGIPGKGKILTAISLFWFDYLGDLLPNHLITADVREYPSEARRYVDILAGRSMVVRKAEPFLVECVVRGYLAGSGWKEYSNSGTVCGEQLSHGLVESSRLPNPIFTPATKEELGSHDENISYKRMGEITGGGVAGKLREYSLELYGKAAEYARGKGILIADTKFEFGRVGEEIILIDEVLTPDSSRFWPQSSYEEGRSQNSFDKQYVRDYLLSLPWDRQAPGPLLPQNIVENTAEKYKEAYRILTGKEIE